MRAKCRKASNAVCISRTSTTSRSATSSRCSRRARSNARRSTYSSQALRACSLGARLRECAGSEGRDPCEGGGRDHVRIRARLEELAGRGEVVREGGDVQRRETVGRPRLGGGEAVALADDDAVERLERWVRLADRRE